MTSDISSVATAADLSPTLSTAGERLAVPSSGEESLLAFASWTLAGLVVLLLLLPVISGISHEAAADAPAPPGEALPASWRLSLRGIGPVRVGMTVAQARRALKRHLRRSSRLPSSGSCAYLEPSGGPEGIYFMVVANRIARIDILNARVETRAGARIGSSEQHLRALYPGRLHVQSNPYLQQGHYLIYTPLDLADRGYSMVFETDGKLVTTFRAGQKREVAYAEHCL
jgi:hypothetical protein